MLSASPAQLVVALLTCAAPVATRCRRAESPYEAAHFKLKGLDPNARYRVNNLDSPGREEMTGRELREEGISVILTGQPEAAIFVYKRLEARQP